MGKIKNDYLVKINYILHTFNGTQLKAIYNALLDFSKEDGKNAKTKSN